MGWGAGGTEPQVCPPPNYFLSRQSPAGTELTEFRMFQGTSSGWVTAGASPLPFLIPPPREESSPSLTPRRQCLESGPGLSSPWTGTPSLHSAPAGRSHRMGSQGRGAPGAGMLAPHQPLQSCLWASLAGGSLVGRPWSVGMGLVGPMEKGPEPSSLGGPGQCLPEWTRAPEACGHWRQCPNKTAKAMTHARRAS